jgi:hypothetical protein
MMRLARVEIICMALFFGPMVIIIWLTPLTITTTTLVVAPLAYVAMRAWNIRNRNRETNNEQRNRRNLY